MLRITLPTTDDPPLFILEGRLAGLWAKEFLRITRDVGPRTRAIFDIREVSYVDQLGEESLCWLNRLGARFIADTAYCRDLCERLHLRCVNAAAWVYGRGRVLRSRTVPPTRPSGPVPSLAAPSRDKPKP